MDEAMRPDGPTEVAVVEQPSDPVRADDRTAPPLIVGIGASAGGLVAYQAFFAAMPADSGMAFVLVQHLDPDHDSALADILGEATTMPVTKAVDGTVPKANTVTVIPPNAILKIENGILQIAKPVSATARRSSVDTFLVSLAQDQGENAVGIILAGYGSDGTIGIAAIKEAGGITFSEAAFDHHAKLGMPQSAADGGFVDNVLPVEAMPAALLEHIAYRGKVASPGGVPAPENPALEAQLVTICAVLHSRLGRDFGQYKNSTMLRRVRRRMQVLRIDEPSEYVEQLRQLPDEPQLLFREILIGVTRFFRDPDLFEALADSVIAELVTKGDPSLPVRVWVAGCATGEEAYSLAILFKEACLYLDSPRQVVIFATDVDDRAIAFARSGLYPDIIEADISRERLDHHFVKEGQRYRVAKHIRDLCVFSTHDLVKDPPFSKLDLVTCRNLLIYFETQLQQRVVAMFHYGLKAGGKLWLGPSETIANGTRLFKAADKRSRIYDRIDTTPVLLLPPARARAMTPDTRAIASPVSELDAEANRILAHYAPAYMIVDSQNEILRFSGSLTRYLEPMSGGASLNLSRLLHPDLRAPARTLLKRAADDGSRVQEQVPFRLDGRAELVNIIVEPMGDGSAGPRHVLLAFQDVVQSAPGRTPGPGASADDVPHGELLAAREKLQVVTEELETANEELQSSNEEFQSVNEELHSTVEELETSKEELQSINEELHTVNAELNNRADSLVRSNSDLANLFDSTSVATLFLDNDFRIRRFTPAVADVFNVQEGDEGRLITDFASRISGDALVADARVVLRDLTSIEREVDSDDGKSTFLLRIRPYRSLNNVIDGVSITLVDISERKHLDKARAHLAAIVESSEDAIISHDLDGLVTSWNHGAEKIYGYTSSEIIGQPMATLLAEAQLDEWPAYLARLRNGETLTNFDISRTTKDDRSIHLSLTISPICDDKGRIVGASAVARNIADRKAAEERAAMLMSELDHRVKNILAVVLSVVSQTLRIGSVPDPIRMDIEGRIMAIARAHNLVADQGGVASSLRELFRTELEPFVQNSNITLTGPDVSLTSNASLIVALAVHELTTNATKYGALSVAEGVLAIDWTAAADDSGSRLSIVWQEHGGPVVAAPARRGFGTKLIELSLVRGLGAKVERTFAPEGVRCQITLPLSPEVGSLLPRPGDET
ncbi:CheR family methyltransferase [Polymorphobacter fuscus]|uniref:histidine kinase n=1 Tax=Sandarakinorhabdus fusca TaxID=1439888 RepID=A0A7C9KKC3_9SPHN|nr:CheR family methyltransferase [Polymorphobacter fuscus]KAB7648803.1 PAS domain S-box protein [Polymorphobacter fuscus]MQT16383.1 PAS domain S-box protein [Polymorphobacter fuscus]